MAFSDVIPVWRDKTSSAPSRDSIDSSGKRAFEHYRKYLSAIQRSNQKLRPFSATIPVWRDKTSFSPSWIP